MKKREWTDLEAIDEHHSNQKLRNDYVKKIAKILKKKKLDKKPDLKWEEKQENKILLSDYIKNFSDPSLMNKNYNQEQMKSLYNIEEDLNFKPDEFHKNFFKDKITKSEKDNIERFFKMVDSHLTIVSKKI